MLVPSGRGDWRPRCDVLSIPGRLAAFQDRIVDQRWAAKPSTFPHSPLSCAIPKVWGAAARARSANEKLESIRDMVENLRPVVRLREGGAGSRSRSGGAVCFRHGKPETVASPGSGTGKTGCRAAPAGTRGSCPTSTTDRGTEDCPKSSDKPRAATEGTCRWRRTEFYPCSGKYARVRGSSSFAGSFPSRTSNRRNSGSVEPRPRFPNGHEPGAIGGRQTRDNGTRSCLANAVQRPAVRRSSCETRQPGRQASQFGPSAGSSLTLGCSWRLSAHAAA